MNGRDGDRPMAGEGAAEGGLRVEAPNTRVLLLVEDNPGDAQLVREFLAEAGRENYRVLHASRMAEAVEVLRTTEVDVVVLDLRLPDCSGIDTVKMVRECVGQTPIVVLTGTDDEQIALDCINAGAQDYLAKAEVRTQTLKRAIGYAITRIREAQLRELQETVERYRAMSSATQGTTVTAALAGSGAISLRDPDLFDSIVDDYFALFVPFLSRQIDRLEAPRAATERIVTLIGDASGGPRDLLDIHVAALDRANEVVNDTHPRSIVFEARLLALEMMGLLVDYYRVGHRRRFEEDGKA